MTTPIKFWVSWESDGQKCSRAVHAANRDSAEKFVQDLVCNATNIYVQTMKSAIDGQIRDQISKVKIVAEPGKENDKWNDRRRGEIEQRLRCCADMALILGEESQESLLLTLTRVVECDWEITGLDGHMFSFGFKSNNFWGGIIFHCSAKEWSIHT